MSSTRSVVGYFVVNEPDTTQARECPDCGFGSLLGFPVRVISEAGVGDWGTTWHCVRCWEESQ